jgi:hypothetical protein
MGAVGCCTKKDCASYTPVVLHRFLPSEVDSIVCYRYEKTGSFINLLDSFRFYILRYDSTTGISENPLPGCSNGGDYKGAAGYDHKIRLSGTGRQITLTGLETEQKGCNKCFPVPLYSDYFDVLKAYKVDGKHRESSSIEIYK